MALTLAVAPGELEGDFTVSGSTAAGSIKGARLTGDCGLLWSAIGTFTADGTQTIAVARGAWVFVAQSGSMLADPQHVYVRNADDNIHAVVFDAVVARLESLALPLIEGRVHRRSFGENIGGSWPCVFVEIPTGLAETSGSAGNNVRSDWGYPVRVTIADRVLSKLDPDAAVKPMLEVRRIAFAAFDRKRLASHPDVYDTRVEPGPIRQRFVTDGGTGYHINGSVFTVRAAGLVRRGF